MGRCAWDGEVCLGWGGVPGMGRCAWDGEVCLGWGGVPGMRRCAWDGEVCLGWGGRGSLYFDLFSLCSHSFIDMITIVFGIWSFRLFIHELSNLPNYYICFQLEL